MIVTNEAGLSDFKALRKAITSRQHALYIQFSQALPGDAKAIFHLVDEAGLEEWCRSVATASIAAARRRTG